MVFSGYMPSSLVPLILPQVVSWLPLISNCSKLPFVTQGRSWRLESCLPETGNKKASGQQKGLRAQESHRASLGFSLSTREVLCFFKISYLPTLSLELSRRGFHFNKKKKLGPALSPENLSYKDVSARE